MKVAALILTMFLAAVSAAGQVTSLKNEGTSVSTTFGQVQKIDVTKYLALLKAAESASSFAPYRATTITKYNEGKIEKYVKEFVPPDRIRQTAVFPDSSDDCETINIGEREYERQKARWYLVTFKIEEGSCLWRTPFELWNTGTVKDFTLEYQKVNGENVTVIKKEEIETPRYRGRTFFTTIKLGAKGHFISGEERIEQGGQNELVSTSETIYVYNPKDLKIEAPAIK